MMKLTLHKRLNVVLFFLFLSYGVFSQTFWTETFGTGCNQGTLADGYVSPNGQWLTRANGVANGTDRNIWYISATENGEGVGNCGAVCGANPTLHIGNASGDFGATYLAGDGGMGLNPATDVTAESPLIDCSGQCGIELSYEYMESGDGTNDNMTLEYYDGTSWSILDDPAKTPTTCAPQGQWTQYTFTLPASADNNPAVKIGFRWVNNNDGIGTDPSVAIYNIQLTSTDATPPVMSCVGSTDVYINSSSCDAQVPDLVLPPYVTVSDNCTSSGDLIVSQDIASGTLISGHNTTVTVNVTVDDLSGNTNTCAIDVTALDTISPSNVCPTTQIIEADASCSGTLTDYTSLATISDNCSAFADLTIQQSPTSGTTINSDQVVSIEATDEQGNSRTCTFLVDLVDTTSPVITTCAPDQVENVGNSCEANVGDYTSLVAANDNCDSSADLTVTQSPSVGVIISSTTTVTLTVTDQAGNSSTCNLQVTLEDNVSPVPDCSNDTVVAINSSCEYGAPDVTGIVPGTDNCSLFADMTITQDIAPGTTLTGSDQIEVSLTDENGNTGTCLVDVIPDDQVPPVISCPSNQTFSNGTNCDYAITDFTALASVTDNCPNVVVSQVPAVGTSIGTGTHDVLLIATDPSGNADTCSFFLTVTESVAPTLDCPADITTCDPIVTYAAPVVTENCNGFTITQTDISGLTSGDEFPIGVTVQSYEVADSSGNTGSCSFQIEVLEYPDTPNINTTTTGLCDTTSISLNADDPASGTGEWAVTEGGATLNNEFANVTGANNLTYGNNTFVWTVSTPACGSLSDTLTVTVYEQPLPASTQDTLTVCGDTSIAISANQASAGTGVWSGQDSVLFLDENSPNTVAYNLEGGWNDMVWTISNGTCQTSSDTLVVFNKQNSVIFNEDTTVCLTDGGFELQGTQTVDGVNAIWYVTSGGADITNSTTSNPFISNIKGGENIIVFGQSHSICPTTADTIIVTGEQCGEYDPLIPTVITPNEDGKNDLFVLENLNILYPDAQVRIVNRWGNLVFESTGYELPWNGTMMNEGEPLPVGTYFYRILLNDEQGTEITGPISIIR